MSKGKLQEFEEIPLCFKTRENPIWNSNVIKRPNKLELYRVLVLSIATYRAATWTLKKSDEQRLRVFEMA